ncbi:MAG: ARMT1-like domain-containing protein, partial [Chromatiales bacterium]
MKTYLDCYPCFLRQALSASRRAGATEQQQQQILHLTMQELANLPAEVTPPRMAFKIHRQVCAQTQSDDPYRQAKAQATRKALDLYPMLKERVAASSHPLETAARIAIAGNIIDLGAAESYDLQANLARVLTQKLAINGLDTLRKALHESPAILYLADNAGETVFDRVLIEHLDRPVTYVVKAAPIINDATFEDAVAAGIDRIAEIIDNGSNA